MDWSNETTAAEAITGLIESWAAAVRRHDLAGVLARHAENMLMFDVVGPIEVRGRDAYATTWTDAFFPWHGGNGRFDLRDLVVHGGSETAFATALIDCAGTEDGRPSSYTLRLTVGLERRADGWTVVHEHHSEPLPFDQTRIG